METPHWDIYKTKPSYPFDARKIKVFDSAVDIEFQKSVLDGVPVFLINGNRWSATRREFSVRSQHEIEVPSPFVSWRWRQWLIELQRFCPTHINFPDSCNSFAEVFNNRSNGKFLISIAFKFRGFHQDPRPFAVNQRIGAVFRSVSSNFGCFGLLSDHFERAKRHDDCCNSCREKSNVGQVFRGKQATEIAFRVTLGPIFLLVGCLTIYYVSLNGRRGWRRLLVSFLRIFGVSCIGSGLGAFFLPVYWQDERQNDQRNDSPESHSPITVTQKLLTMLDNCNTLIPVRRTQMANALSTDKQIAIIAALAEGSSIRAIERMTGVHRDTIMRLGVRVGQGCATLLDEKMRNLPCEQLQFDEIWGFIGKKERHCNINDNPEFGDVWTFCAIDRDTKIVPSFRCGKRDLATANAFVADVALRMRNRVQISSDALRAYVDAIEMNFGADVDFAQIVKTYVTDDSHVPERRFSAPEIVITEKKAISGFPDMGLASTSHVERLNGTTRLHMRRLTRLTYAFSKRLDNFKAAAALHFAYYNFVKRHITLRATPAMAAGIERDFWKVGDLLEAAI
jgi:IS1 family transposase